MTLFFQILGSRGVDFLMGELSWFLGVDLVLVAAAKYTDSPGPDRPGA